MNIDRVAKRRRRNWYRMQKLQLRFERQKALCDSFILRGKEIPGIYLYNLHAMASKLMQRQAMDELYANEIARWESMS